MADNNDVNIKTASEVLGKPFQIGFDDNALKVRRNLFLFGSITLYIAITGITVNPDTTVSGIHFQGLDDNKVYLAFLIVNLYHFFHFLWYAVESFAEWRLRLSGIGILKRVSLSDSEMLYDENLSDPRQSTLYNWWLSRGEKIRHSHDVVINDILKTIDAQALSKLNTKGALNSDASDSPVDYTYCVALLNKVQTSSDLLSGTIHNKRILFSLKRFDDWYVFFLQSQSLRWILIECLLPLILGFASIILLTDKIYPDIWPQLLSILNSISL